MIMMAGFGSFALFIGFLLGASNTPVIAPFLTAVFGLIGSVVGAEYLVKKQNNASFDTETVGKTMLAISLLLFLGTLTGDYYRSEPFSQQEKIFPWDGSNSPASTREAIDWILVNERMTNLGYSDENIKEIYKIRLQELTLLKKLIEQEKQAETELWEKTEIYDKASPFYSMFSNDRKKISMRGPASEN